MIHINDLSTTCPLYKYVDDCTMFEVCTTGATSVIQESADTAAKWSKENDMCINASKSFELIIDFSKNHQLSKVAIPIVMDGTVITRIDSVKLLGVTISSNLTWNAHVDNIVKKASKRIYVLYQLKRAGISQSDLMKIYLSIIRPVVEYACPVWNTNLPKYLSDEIEVVQKRALRTIFPGLQYKDLLNLTQLETLSTRRDMLCKKYFIGMKQTNHKLHHLLPKPREIDYSLRSKTMLPQINARTNRYKNSLIPWGLSHT